MYDLAIVIPVYNPQKDWYPAFDSTLTSLRRTLQGVNYTIVVVDDGTVNPDRKALEKILDHHPAMKLYSYPLNRGKGYAIRYGLSRAEAHYCIYTDADFPFGHEVVRQFYQFLKDGQCSFVLGRRSPAYYRKLPFRRRFLSWNLHAINSILTGFKIRDTQAGIKGMDAGAKNEMLTTQTCEFLFDLEFVLSCLRKKLPYKMVDITPRGNIEFSNFRMRIVIREAGNLFKIIFR